jgi:hypothetical protein
MARKESDFAAELDQVRPVTRDLIESILFDSWPSNAAVIDFGLNNQEHYEALYYPIREGELIPLALDDALGDGAKLTALVRAAPSKPHKDVQFYTSWDVMFGRPSPQGALPESEKLAQSLDRLEGEAAQGPGEGQESEQDLDHEPEISR